MDQGPADFGPIVTGDLARPLPGGARAPGRRSGRATPAGGQHRLAVPDRPGAGRRPGGRGDPRAGLRGSPGRVRSEVRLRPRSHDARGPHLGQRRTGGGRRHGQRSRTGRRVPHPARHPTGASPLRIAQGRFTGRPSIIEVRRNRPMATSGSVDRWPRWPPVTSTPAYRFAARPEPRFVVSALVSGTRRTDKVELEPGTRLSRKNQQLPTHQSHSAGPDDPPRRSIYACLISAPSAPHPPIGPHAHRQPRSEESSVFWS